MDGNWQVIDVDGELKAYYTDDGLIDASEEYIINEDHDCHIGPMGESGCDHPSHGEIE